MSPHDVTNEQLVQFVLAELPAGEAGGIEAHLEQCESCRREVKRLRSLLDCADRMSDVREDEHVVQSANRKVLLNAGTEDKDQRRRGYESSVAIFWRTVMSSRMTKLAVAAAVILAATIGLNLFTSNSAGKVYARAVSQLHRAQTLTYSMITKTGLESTPTVRTDVMFKDVGDTSFVRVTTPDGYITVAQAIGNKMKGLTFIPVAKNFVRFELDNMPDDPAKDPFANVEMLRALPAQADEELGRKEVEGRVLDGFRFHDGDTVTTVWIDPANGQPARVEIEVPSAPAMNAIITDFRLDTPLEDSLFSLEPPQGYFEFKVQADAAQIGEKDFVEFLRAWSQWTVDGTFPPMVAGVEVAKVTVQMAQEGRLKPGIDYGLQDVMYRGLVFVSALPSGAWRYAGQNVPFGDPAVPIFWYQPQGSATWRIIYADLHVTDVTTEDLPK